MLDCLYPSSLGSGRAWRLVAYDFASLSGSEHWPDFFSGRSHTASVVAVHCESEGEPRRQRCDPGLDRGEIELQVFSGRSPRYIAIQNSSSVNVMVTVPCGASRDVFPLAQGYTSFVRVPSGVRFCVVSVTANNGHALRR